MYLNESALDVQIMGRGMAWLDTGTFDSLQEAGEYIRALEKRQGLKFLYPEEVAWRKGWISDNELEKIAQKYIKSGYGEYLFELLKMYSLKNLKKIKMQKGLEKYKRILITGCAGFIGGNLIKIITRIYILRNL